MPGSALAQKAPPRPPNATPESSISTPTSSSYDKDRDIVTADGDVVLYYKNRVLQGDHVVYDRKAKRVFASGHVKVTDEHGNVTYSQRAELTEDFASGFADAVQVLTVDKTRLSRRPASSDPTTRSR